VSGGRSMIPAIFPIAEPETDGAHTP